MARFCSNCAAALPVGAFACPACAQPVTPAVAAPAAPARQGQSALIVAGVSVGMLTALAFGGVFLVGRLSSDTPDPVQAAATASASATPQATTSPTPSATSPAPAAPPAAGFGDVRDQPPGLLCRDLKAKGFSYAAAVTYWGANGQPDRMDADVNGIPCETVYPATNVRAYWLTTPAPRTALPAGLLCKDVAARGVGYPGAVAYWFAEGQPARMDIDGNGIPCETVYPTSDVAAFWF